MHGGDRSTIAYRNMWLAGDYSCKISTSYLPYQSILSLLLRISEMKRRNTPQRRYFQLRAISITRGVAIRARLNSVTWAAVHRDLISRAFGEWSQGPQHGTKTVKEKNWNHPFKDVFKRQAREKLIGKKKAATSKTATRTLLRSFATRPNNWTVPVVYRPRAGPSHTSNHTLPAGSKSYMCNFTW